MKKIDVKVPIFEDDCFELTIRETKADGSSFNSHKVIIVKRGIPVITAWE